MSFEGGPGVQSISGKACQADGNAGAAARHASDQRRPVVHGPVRVVLVMLLVDLYQLLGKIVVVVHGAFLLGDAPTLSSSSDDYTTGDGEALRWTDMRRCRSS